MIHHNVGDGSIGAGPSRPASRVALVAIVAFMTVLGAGLHPSRASALLCGHYIHTASWAVGESGYPDALVLEVNPTGCGRVLAVTDFSQAWQEIVSKAGGVPSTSAPSLEVQFECHALSILAPIRKEFYDLEPWRPVLSLVEELEHDCNPAPMFPQPYEVGIGAAGITISSATTSNFVAQLDVGAQGEPSLPVNTNYPHDTFCYQSFEGGSLGETLLIAHGDCAAPQGASTYWVGQAVVTYLDEHGSVEPAIEEVGWPEENPQEVRRGWEQAFGGGERGSSLLLMATRSPNASVYDVYEPVLRDYLSVGGPKRRLGFPTSEQVDCGAGEVCQDFEGGEMESESDGSNFTIAQPDQLVKYGASGYTYDVVSHGALAGFQAPTFKPKGFTAGGVAPFSSGGGCGYVSATYWPPDTDLVLRNTVNIPSNVKDVAVSVAIDNNIVVYWNGIEIGNDEHGGCASDNSFTYPVPAADIQPGPNLLAVRAIDTGDVSDFDATVTGKKLMAGGIP